MKKFVFYIDDNIRFCEKITLNKPKSIFDDPYIGLLKKLHDKYGVSVQLNMFYEYESFNLSQMTSAYKQEWIDNASWLKFGFHAKGEFPDYPYAAVSYEQFEKEHDQIINEIKRFAGEENISHSYVTHWITLTDKAVQVLADKGVKMTVCTTGEPDKSPEIMSALSSGHRDRALAGEGDVSRPFVACRNVNGMSGFPYVCNYNHLNDAEADKHFGVLENIYRDEKTGVYFNRPASITVNAAKYVDIPKKIENLTAKRDYIAVLIHEQYFYPDYFAYEKDFGDKLDLVIKLLLEKGYENMTLDDVVAYQK